MANQEHLEILKRGVSAWNTWRHTYPNIQPDLSNVSLSYLEVGRKALEGEQFTDRYTKEDDLYQDDPPPIDFRNVDLHQTDLKCANLMDAKCSGANFQGANLSRTRLMGANLNFANLDQASLFEAEAFDARFTHASLRYTNLAQAHLSGAVFRDADLQEADLSDAFLHEVDLSAANLSQAHLRRAVLHGANLTQTNLGGANLSDAELVLATLTRTRLQESDLTNVVFGGTIFAACDLSNIRGLETARHLGPSTLGIDTFLSSHGSLPDQFLQGIGLVDTLGAMHSALIPFQRTAMNCFICRDEPNVAFDEPTVAFADQLCEDLHGKGFPCWSLSWRDLTKSDGSRKRRVSLYNRFLLVLWEGLLPLPGSIVERRIKQLLEQEQQEHRHLLFVLCLDQVALDKIEEYWPQFLQEAWRLQNFTNWEMKENYLQSLDHLRRDLI
jgi:uncharacterized protein YjbI with pentapeptide repeats